MRSGATTGRRSPPAPGSTCAPPESAASRASSPSAGGSAATPSSRQSHSSIAPAANTPPSSAYSVRPAIVQATVGSSPPAGLGDLLADVREHEHPGPVGGLHTAWNDGARSGERRLLVDGLAAQPQLGGPARVSQRAELAGGLANLRQDLERHAECRAQRGIEGAGRVDALQLGPRRGGRVGGEPGSEAVAEERVDRAHPQGAGVARGRHLVGVLEQPGELGGGEVRVVGKPARLLDLLLVGLPAGRAPPASACPARRRSGSAAGRSRPPRRAPTRPGGRARRRPPPPGLRRALRRSPPPPRSAPPRRPARPSRAADSGWPCRAAPRPPASARGRTARL